MKRREFLKATIVAAGGVVLGPGCGEEGESTPAEDTAGTPDSPPGDPGTSTGSDPGVTADIPTDTGGPPRDLVHFPQSVASGDPRPGSAVLWTRVQDPARAGVDLEVELEVSTSESFDTLVSLDGGGARSLTAEAAFDNCVKARIDGLDPATIYYYRFHYSDASEAYLSPVGRFKTAPAEDADVPVRFAWGGGQDYGGRYYNTFRRMLDMELDFFVHLGDYVYETTGNPQFQDPTETRRLTFGKPEEAITLGEGDHTYEAARSLDNYRDLYRIYRSDPDLQSVHERFAMIAVWDDHEYSNDCHGAVATYFNGEVDEEDVERRKAANQAWFEYMPVDYPAGPDFRYDPKADFPGDLVIHRDFTYGKHLHLVMTDLRTWRNDHPVAEDAYPGKVVMTAEDLKDAPAELKDKAGPYVDIESFDGGRYLQPLRDAAKAEGYDDSRITGKVAAGFINSVVTALNEAAAGGAEIPLIDLEANPDLERGFAYRHMGKMSLFSSIGSRSFVVTDVYRPWTKQRYEATGGASEVMFGADQRSWFLDKMKTSTRTWKVWGNEFMLMPLIANLSGVTALPESFRNRYQLLAEDWSGIPNRRDEIIAALADVENVFVASADVHAFFAGVATLTTDDSKGIPELVSGAVSSGSLKSMLIRTAQGDPVLRDAGATALAMGAQTFLLDRTTAANPYLADAYLEDHGVAVAEVSGDRLEAWFFRIPETHVKARIEDKAELEAAFTEEHYRVPAGKAELHKEIDGTWKRWDLEKMEWVSA